MRSRREARACGRTAAGTTTSGGHRADTRRRPRDRAFLTQHHQPSLECCPVSALDCLPSGSMSEVALDDVFIEISQRAAVARDPTQEPADHVEATPNAEPNAPLLDETSGVAFDEVSVRPASETPEQPAFTQVFFNFHRPVLRC
jgi:hypothetical protein